MSPKTILCCSKFINAQGQARHIVKLACYGSIVGVFLCRHLIRQQTLNAQCYRLALLGNRIPIRTSVECDWNREAPAGKVRISFNLSTVPEERMPEAERFLATLVQEWGGGHMNYVSHTAYPRQDVTITGFVDASHVKREIGNTSFYLCWMCE
jgi:hypothetical protein